MGRLWDHEKHALEGNEEDMGARDNLQSHGCHGSRHRHARRHRWGAAARHCHGHRGHGAHIEMREGMKRLVLAGNPNVGKSVFFNYFTGMYVDVSNYPGTTIEISSGRYRDYLVMDTPGVYGVSSFNDEERVARDVILTADLILNVVDAVHLERDLFLTLQLIDMGIPMVVALNMMDEAEERGLAVDAAKLEALLGVPVVPTVATKRRGLSDVAAALERARPGLPHPEVAAKIRALAGEVGSPRDALLILEDDEPTARRYGVSLPGTREEIYLMRRRRANDIAAAVVSQKGGGRSLSAILGAASIRPITGIPILALVLVGLYYLVGVFVAQTVVDFTEGTVMAGLYEPWIRGVLGRVLDLNGAIGKLLAGEFGLLTMTVTYVFGLLLPLVVGFYLALSLMEDSGYLPRLATLLDRLFTRVGLNGRAVIPVILGFGCVTMATITTRLLGSGREKRIATLLLALTIPCSAQLGVVVGLLGGLGAKYIAGYILVIGAVFLTVGTLLDRILPGRSTDLFIDLPPIRLPKLDNVAKKTMSKSYMFLTEAGPLFVLGSLIIGVMDITGALTAIQDLAAPLVEGWLRLPREAATAFIMGIVRRDFGAAGLYDMALSPGQTLVALITLTLFVPCIASMIVIAKERGAREGVLVWLTTWTLAFTVGGVVARVIGL